MIIPFIPSQRHISISHLLSPTHHPPSLHLKLTRSPLLFTSSTHFQVARVKPLAMSHPRSTLHWIQFRLESKTNHIGRWQGDDGFMTDDDIHKNKHPLLPVVEIWGSAVVAFVATYVVGWTNPWKANRVPSRAIIPCFVPNRFFPVLFFQLTRDLILPYIILLSFPEDIK